MKRSKILIVLLAFFLLTACGNKKEEDNNPTNNTENNNNSTVIDNEEENNELVDVLDCEEDDDTTVNIPTAKATGSLKISQDEILFYLYSVPFVNKSNVSGNNLTYNDAYSGSKLVINNLNSNLYGFMAWNEVGEEDSNVKVREQLMGDLFLETFGYELPDNALSNKFMYFDKEVELKDGKYQYNGNKISNYEEIKKSVKSLTYYEEDGKLIIEEEALFFDANAHENRCEKIKVYSNSNDAYLGTNVYTTIDKFSDKIDKSYTKFKHTFIKTDLGYGWYSTETI